MPPSPTLPLPPPFEPSIVVLVLVPKVTALLVEGLVRGTEAATLAEWRRDFEAAAQRSLEQRMKYAFIKTYKPVLDDAPFRAFDSMAEYRKWCEEHLPSWLGYGRSV